MKYAVRKVVSAKKDVTLGYGVFPDYQVVNTAETGSINIAACSALDDERPLHEQHKSYRLKGLYDTITEAGTHARRHGTVKVQRE